MSRIPKAHRLESLSSIYKSRFHRFLSNFWALIIMKLKCCCEHRCHLFVLGCTDLGYDNCGQESLNFRGDQSNFLVHHHRSVDVSRQFRFSNFDTQNLPNTTRKNRFWVVLHNWEFEMENGFYLRHQNHQEYTEIKPFQLASFQNIEKKR